MEEKAKVTTVSLDHTLVAGNSLDLLANFLLRHALRHGKFGLSRRLYNLKCRRNNSDISMRRFKFELMKILRGMHKPSPEDFAAHLRKMFEPRVISLLDKKREEGDIIVLLTSAPREYAGPVSRTLDIDHCICTPSLSEFRNMYPSDPIDYVECAGTEKLHHLNSMLEENQACLSTVITGESDDLPLLRYSGAETRIITSRSKSLRRTLRREGILFEIL